MALRDRGKIKWQSAFFMPEHMKMLKDLRREDLKIAKPILDEYQIEDFERKIKLALEYKFPVKIKVWEDGFIQEYSGKLHRVDDLNRIIYLEAGESILKVAFNDVIGIEVIDFSIS